jgi:pectinesterase
VIFKNTEIDAKINAALWSIWNPGDERTDDVFFADYNTTGSGITTISRPSFATALTASQAQAYSISSAVGSNYTAWVDMAYFV